ncbi:MAG: hypothetical protein LJF04_12470 [Gemmatimonadetes bacterium]|nr:hypothetical protein [Gemmatimonadota bacterium]
MLTFILTAVWIGAAGSMFVWGLDYYLLPIPERAFSPLAPLFSPTGVVGQGLGIVGAAMILLGVVGYTARKRWRILARAGQLKHWLQVHIFLCTLGPFFVLLHTTFKFGGVVSIAFWSMAIVVASGVFGRYVYVRIPKTLNGRFLDLDSIAGRIQSLTSEIAGRTGLDPATLEAATAGTGAPPRGLVRALAYAVADDVAQRRHTRGIRRLLRQHQVPQELRRPVLDLVAERRKLRQQTLVLQPFQRLFRYWHVIHLPLAGVMFLILGVHVFVAILFGYTWIF